MHISSYLLLMVEQGASDLFFTPDSPVLIKVEGISSPLNEAQALSAAQVKSFAYSLMKDHQLHTFEQQWDISIGVTIENVGRFRVSIFRQRNQVAMVIRLVRSEPPQLDSLNLPEYLKQLVMLQRGLILVAGATGSGKSSTLAAMIDHRNSQQHGHILTIEDPIEFIHTYKKSVVNQREVGEDTKSFDSALKSAMREAPDVILIGEIRDESTMRNAINYAETGHLCLATIHASNSIETLDRVINLFPERQHKQLLIDLSHNLRAIVCQRLIPGLEGKRWPAVEILRDTPFIKELIKQAKVDEIRDALERNLEKEITTFDNAVLALYQARRITKEHAIAYGDSQHNVEVQIRLLDSKAVSEGRYDDVDVDK
ncbi:twitching motility protein PilT [Shewanella colwelliana]|uniref:Twitching motility protein PilT n=1 Tax=Shewanella colwelliana TaxID=23 RepID=A0A1E5IZM3_SHECO|nr:PilT/PilU family type 4a pilus ATPase [Shewanella colwelliana]MDX1282076.1 PilT/PilU family type 4a pilus ATPase [Shewanella colwelliana]OEG75884.1 type IV pili twitching motility protein PilT [Shewanella colwelliana]GIU24197.1 twitching motility protein PilT [Shewanella colwelliana]GIU41456.1 twitching motility protein PilT [Shewanella colwelliana]